MKRKTKVYSPEARKIIDERIKTLFENAELIYRQDRSLADRYVRLAIKLSMKYKIPIKSEYKRRFCRHCRSYLIPGLNCRVRTRDRKVIYLCQSCKRHSRIPFYKEVKEKRKRCKNIKR